MYFINILNSMLQTYITDVILSALISSVVPFSASAGQGKILTVFLVSSEFTPHSAHIHIPNYCG
jgi:hypothetical protein